MPRETTAESSEAVMASLIVIALVMIVAGVLVGAFIAISFAISRGHRVRSADLEGAGPGRQGTRPLTGSGRRG